MLDIIIRFFAYLCINHTSDNKLEARGF